MKKLCIIIILLSGCTQKQPEQAQYDAKSARSTIDRQKAKKEYYKTHCNIGSKNNPGTILHIIYITSLNEKTQIEFKLPRYGITKDNLEDCVRQLRELNYNVVIEDEKLAINWD